MKIEFTERELIVLKKYENGELENPAGEDRKIICDIAERALAYEMETESDDESDDLIAWYYNEYKAQQHVE